MSVEDVTLNSQDIKQQTAIVPTPISKHKRKKRFGKVPIYIIIDRIFSMVPKDNTLRSDLTVARLINADFRNVKKAFQVIDKINKFPYPIDISYGPGKKMAIRIGDKKKIDSQDMAKQLLFRAYQLLEQTER